MPAILLNMVSGLLGQMRDLDVASRNLTNMRTPGYRKERLSFRDLVYQATQLGRDRAAERGPAEVGAGTDTRQPELVHTQGEFEVTGRAYDLAIRGDGFFQFRSADGSPVYSRHAALQLDGERRLVSLDGLPLQPEIRLPEGVVAWRVATGGTVVGQRADGTEEELETRLALTRFPNPSALGRQGPYLLIATDRSGPPAEGTPGEDGVGEVLQGQLELSNVDFTEEIVNMLHAQRTYQVSLRALQALDESLALANNIRR